MTTTNALEGQGQLPPYVLIVTGGVDAPRGPVQGHLDDYARENGRPLLLIHGGAFGADSHAGEWADRNSVPYIIVPALWKGEGRATAGNKRNRRMMVIALAVALGWSVTHGFDVVAFYRRMLFSSCSWGVGIRAIAFPTPKSRGTLDMIAVLADADVPTTIREVRP